MRSSPLIFKCRALTLRAVVDGQVLGDKFPFDGCPSRRELEIGFCCLPIGTLRS